MRSFLLRLIAAHALTATTVASDPEPVDPRDLPITRSGSKLLLNGKPWKAVGPNVYWLGLDENVTPPAGEPYYAPTRASYPNLGRTTEIMAVTKAMGGTMMRTHTLGVSTGNPLSVMPTAGQINEQAFDAIDWAVWQAREYGLRLMIPLTDNFDYYHGGKFDFLRWAGFNLTRDHDEKNPAVQKFYTDAKVVGLFKDYIRALLTHVNSYTNMTYAADPTIFAYETGNELTGPVWKDMDVPVEWIREISRFVKQLAPQKLVVDGTYGVNSSHLAIEEVDIYSNHHYPISLNVLKRDLALGEAPRSPPLALYFLFLFLCPPFPPFPLLPGHMQPRDRIIGQRVLYTVRSGETRHLCTAQLKCSSEPDIAGDVRHRLMYMPSLTAMSWVTLLLSS